MPKRTAVETAASRERIIASAGALMRARGFDGVGIDAIVEHAGMTAGAFYRHFASKQQLLETVIERAMMQAAAQMPQIERPEDVTTFISAYLRQRKLKEIISGCVVAAMGPDLLRNGSATKARTGEYLRGVHAAISRALRQTIGDNAPAVAWQLMSAATGGLLLARLLGGTEADEITGAILAQAQRVVRKSRAKSAPQVSIKIL